MLTTILENTFINDLQEGESIAEKWEEPQATVKMQNYSAPPGSWKLMQGKRCNDMKL